MKGDISYTGLFDLRGKVAIVTGGAGILGRHFCAGLAESHATVVVADVRAEDGQTLATSLTNRYGSEAVGIGCDVSSEDSVRALVTETVERYGRIDVLHNNAASKSHDLEAFFAPFEDYTLAQWREIMAVNIDGMFLMAREVGKQMVSQGTGGSIIQTASVYGVVAPDERIYEGSSYMGRPINTPAVYSVSKAAVIGLTKYLSAHWAGHGVRVNTLSPGGTESGQNDEFKRRYSARVPMNRMAQASEMVGALLFLASDASSYVTGHNIIVDGGLHAW
jgi:NAD(P)-dependent dehydrogenase (short-subunit alcohol dehydrogenase family)